MSLKVEKFKIINVVVSTVYFKQVFAHWVNIKYAQQETADLVTFTEVILNGKLHFLRSDMTNNWK